MINYSHFRINKKYLKYFLIFGWMSCWASLSFNPYKFYLIIEKINLTHISLSGLLEALDICRGLFQIIYLPILLLSFFALVRNKGLALKSNIIYLLFVILLLIETFSLFNTENSIANIYFVICSLNIILTIFLFKNFFSENDMILIFRLSAILLLVLLIYFGFQYFFVAFREGMNIYASWGTAVNNTFHDVPRPTGLARTCLIIFIIFSNINFFKKPFDKINFFITILSITLLILLSSRTSIFIYLTYIVFYIFYFKIFELKNLFILLKKFILLPIVFVFILGILQNLNIAFQEKFSSFSNLSIFSFNTKNIARDYPKIETSQLSEFTSGRRADWKNILEFNERKILGNGVLGDRFLINQSASNLLFYTYASSGIIGVLIIVSISILVLLQVFKIFFNKKNKYEPYKFSSCIILLALMMRSILETSYGVFGIDFIIFCICFSLIIPQKKIYGSN